MPILMKEIQIKRILRSYLISIRMPKIINWRYSTSWQGGRARKTLLHFMEQKTCTITLEINFIVSKKTGNTSTGRLSYATPRHIPKLFHYLQHLLNYICRRYIHNRQTLETTLIFLNWKMNKQKCGSHAQWNTTQLLSSQKKWYV